jgi:NADH-quinone oxidoreductase subunit G
MIEIELDGKKVSVPEGSMVMHAADAAGAYIPHFCYHKKLSIAANCRMCLVEVEKAPKPMPACATPVTNGMVVRTRSRRALEAQQSVMEFLLINHPLDCPICDQGGECQLQDLAVGYGKSASRYDEEKRVVLSKDVGPLISMEEMTRCIHCTRCVRFGQEIAGVMELGMVNRGEHSEIMTIDGESIDSELSGNMIDICPVGALTSKPFRYSARTWELSRRKSVSPHDSTGSNLIVQVKAGEVKRVVPLENEAVNECWIADRDRFSYEALHAPSRLVAPMIKQGGQWQTADWTTALNYVADGLKRVIAEFGPSEVGAVAAPHATLEELHLLAKLVRGLGSDNVDHRLRHAGNVSHSARGVRWLGRSIASLSTLDRALVIGSFLRKDHPLFAQRLRQAARRGAQVHSLGAGKDDWLMPMGRRLVAAPSAWVDTLAALGQAVSTAKAGSTAGEGDAAAIAASLLDGKDKAILLGRSVAQHPDSARIVDLAHALAMQTGATFGWLGDGANDVGAQWVDALPLEGGLSAPRMLSQPMKALLLLDVEPLLDGANPSAARAALEASGLVVALTPFSDVAADYADVMLPIAPFAETSGSFVNAEGRVQSFHGVTKPRGETRPAWKVLRVLGNLLGLVGFDHETSEAVRDEAVEAAGAIEQRLDNTPSANVASTALAATLGQGATLERIADVPIYQSDSLVRRAPALQATADALAPAVALPTAAWQSLGLRKGDRVVVTQGNGNATLVASHDPTLAPTAVRVSAARNETAELGPMFGPIGVRKA